jgi:leucyl-tRNA synthetase
MLSPFTPHICEEMWSMLGGKKFLSLDKWPEYDEKLVSNKNEAGEDLVKNIVYDIREIQKLKGIKPRSVTIFLAEDWKFHIYNIILKNKSNNH